MNGSVPAGAANGSGPAPPAARVLYIEDDAANVRLVAHILGQIDHVTFASAGTAEDALRLAQQLHPSLVLLDLGLLGTSGEEVFRRLRTLPEMQGVPVVIVSGGLSDIRREHLSDSGVAGFLDKPYAIDDTSKALATSAIDLPSPSIRSASCSLRMTCSGLFLRCFT